MRIASVNFFAANRQPRADIDRLNSLNLDVIGFQEAHNDYGLINDLMPKHKLYSDEEVRNDASKEVAVGLHSRNEYLGHNGVQVSYVDNADETRTWKDRWITIVRFTHEGQKYTIINYHGNAAIQNDKGDLMEGLPKVQEWLDAARVIEEKIQFWQSKGHRVIVSGDFNYRRRDNPDFELHYWSPQRTFRRANLEWVEHGLDYLAWPAEMTKVRENTISNTGSDHPWLIVELT